MNRHPQLLERLSFLAVISFLFLVSAGWAVGSQEIHPGEEDALALDSWHYIQVDDQRSKWGDYAEPEWLRYFGQSMGDVNGDGLLDIVAGRHVYLNPGVGLIGRWEKQDLGLNVDAILMVDVDGDSQADVIGQALPDMYWLEAPVTADGNWEARKIGSVPATSHTNSQGFVAADIFSAGKTEILIAGNGNIYAFIVPANPESDPWERYLVAQKTSDEGIGVGDIDRDGDIDIAAGRRKGEEPLLLLWWENPGSQTGDWTAHPTGETSHPIDRVEVADVNGDDRADIIVAEERWPGEEPDGSVFVFEQPNHPKSPAWRRVTIVTQYSTNNLDVADMDRDGDIDLITCEHKGPNPKLQIWENNGSGRFKERVIDRGKESHLGSQVADLEGDGDLDIVSIAWDRHPYLHLWRNDAISQDDYADLSRWTHLSSTKDDFPPPMLGTQQTASLVVDINGDGVEEFCITDRSVAPSVVCYLRHESGWDRLVVDPEPLRIEAGSASHDIDGDGDLDIVFGGESNSNQIWWWENPSPDFSSSGSWTRRLIKDGGANKHHDELFGDFDHDGQTELIFWNQNALSLFMAEIPEDPRSARSWEYSPIFRYTDDGQPEQHGSYPSWKGINEHEGLDTADIDGDGKVDIVGGGKWFKHVEGTNFEVNVIDAGYTFTRSAAGQLIEGGRPEVVLVAGDGTAPMRLYQWQDGTWVSRTLIESVRDGHSIDIVDFNGDGHLDIFSAEMRLGSNPDAKTRIFLGDGKGEFRILETFSGFGLHEAKIADLDGDGDLDILAKPYTWSTPRLDVWINKGQK
jgi:hypothetical protein